MSTPPDASNPAARLRRAEAWLDWAEADYEAAHSEYLVALADAQHAYDEAEAVRLRREQRPVRDD